MNTNNNLAINPIESQREEALRHYQRASEAIHHWSGFVEAAIKAYNPTPLPSTSIPSVDENKTTAAGVLAEGKEKLGDIYFNQFGRTAADAPWLYISWLEKIIASTPPKEQVKDDNNISQQGEQC